jgi:hypothetical protein
MCKYSNKKKFDIPILLIGFNRPQEMNQVLDKILLINPSKLYISCDGPRQSKSDETEIVKNLQINIKKKLKYRKGIKYLFSSKNLGIKFGPVKALNWFFKYEKRGIILEDDCVPGKSFFNFTREMLIRYQNDKRVSMISGENRYSKLIDFKKKYSCSPIAHVWGWASWRRVWHQYEVDLSGHDFNIANRFFTSEKSKRFWRNAFKAIVAGKLNTWAFQLSHLLMRTRTYCIVPSKNLVTNIGFKQNATNTKKSNNFSKSIKSELYSPPYNGEIKMNPELIDILENLYYLNFFSFKRLSNFTIRKIKSILKLF